MAGAWTFESNGKYGVADSKFDQSPATVRSSEVQPNIAGHFASGHESKLTCPLANAFAWFLFNKIGVSRDIINYLNRADLLWDLALFMERFPMGTTFHIAQKLDFF